MEKGVDSGDGRTQEASSEIEIMGMGAVDYGVWVKPSSKKFIVCCALIPPRRILFCVFIIFASTFGFFLRVSDSLTQKPIPLLQPTKFSQFNRYR